MLPRESLSATQRAGEGDSWFGLVGLHVDLQRVLAGESPVASYDQTGEASPLLLGVDVQPR